MLLAARSKPRWPGPHGVAGAEKSRKIVVGPETGHTQMAGGAGGNKRLRVTTATISKVTPGRLPPPGVPVSEVVRTWGDEEAREGRGQALIL